MQFEDGKTRELYSAITGLGGREADEKLMKEAEEITELRSLFRGCKPQ